jgi:predicted ATP-dependent Lon-type protease
MTPLQKTLVSVPPVGERPILVFLERTHYSRNAPKIATKSVRRKGWNNFTRHYGFSTDFFSEILKAQRKTTYYEVIDKYFSRGHHLKQRDSKSVRKSEGIGSAVYFETDADGYMRGILQTHYV